MPGHTTRSGQLSEILISRRRQLWFRISIAGMMAVFFVDLLGLFPMAVWTLSYVALQALELRLFPPERLPLAADDRRGYRGALVLLALNGLVFGASSVMWTLLVGSWGLACAGYLIAGAMLNVVLTTPGSRDAFAASLAPFIVYLVAVPLLALWTGSGISVSLALVLAGAMMTFCAVKLWGESSRSLTSERTARAELAVREARISEDRSFLDAIIENVPAMLVVKDVPDGRFVLLNSAGEALLGVGREEIIGKTDCDLFPEDQAAAFRDADREVIASNGPRVIAAEPITTPGGDRVLRTTKVVISEDGAPKYLLAISSDITEQQQAAVELEAALARAEAANTAKSTFLATMSHEIRTPLNGVLGMAQAMAADALSPTQRERLNVIYESGTGLLSILNDVLDLSKIEARKLELEELDFRLDEVVGSAYAAFSSMANARGLTFSLDLGNAAGAYRGDPSRLRQILYNLISNALKFTERGEIRVTATHDGYELKLRIADTGIGMTDENLSRIFAAFGQADATTTRRFGGTGLGLAISRELAELMGGRIEVESRLGEGSAFTVALALPRVALPDAASSVSDPRSAPALPDTGLRVLAAEDNAVNQLVLRTLLQQVGIEPVLVSDGRAAVQAWEDGAFDLVLMDVQMPDMDGPTAAREIRMREAASGRPRTPIIALTANVMSHQIADYRAAGMDGHVAKPIEAAKLFAALEACFAEADDTAVRGASPAAQAIEIR